MFFLCLVVKELKLSKPTIYNLWYIQDIQMVVLEFTPFRKEMHLFPKSKELLTMPSVLLLYSHQTDIKYW